MIHRINRKNYQIYAFDLESHNDEESIEKQETSMWLGCLIDENSTIDDEASYLYSMDEFIDRLSFTVATARSRLTAPLRGSTSLHYAQDDAKGDGEIPPGGAPSGFDSTSLRSG